MAKTKYRTKIKNGKEYYFFRLRHENLSKPKDIYGTSIKELDKKIKSAIYELENNIQNSKDSFETFLANWLFDVKFINLKPSTKERYEGLYRNYIKDSSLSKVKIKNISLTHIQNYYSELIENGKSPSCIKMIHKLIAPCIRYAYNNNLLVRDFTSAIILPKENEEEKLNKVLKVQPFTIREQKIFINAIKGHELEMLFLTALNSGLRQGELLALTWDDINFDKCYIQVNKAVKTITDVSKDGRNHTRLLVQTPKTIKSIRYVAIPTELSKRLEQHKIKQLELKFKLANLYENNNLVFCTTHGKYFDGSNIRKRFNKIIDSINLDKENKINKIKFHDLRHTYATRLFELGENPKTVQELLGHSNVSITLGTYTHVLDNLKFKASSKLNDLYITMNTNQA